MKWWETIRTALSAIVSHRLRSALTMLGILIGIAAVILTVGLGLGSQKQVGAQISALGSNLLIVSPGSSTSGGLRGGFGSASTLTTADAAALGSTTAAPDIGAVAPVKTTSESLVAQSSNWTTSLVGTNQSWAAVRSRTVASGRFLSAADVSSQATVAVLGSQTAIELFGSTDVVGQTVTVNNVAFQVVGVLASAGSDSSANLDDQMVAPLSTVANRVIGGTTKNSVSTIYLQATSGDALSAAYQEADRLLLNLHNIDSVGGTPDFTIASQQSLLSTVTSVSKTLTVLLTGIAALSLLVGGIGVMNIMLVSVTERTREIGLRKALGARPAAIRRQFLVEATVLGLAGGLLGAALGISGARILPHWLSTPLVVSPLAVGGSIAIAVLIGIVFGVYPATRAARLAPIDALRSE